LIYYLATKAFSNTIRSFLATWGSPLKSKFRVLYYRRVFRQRKFPPGSYIFTDLERLSARETELAATIHKALTAAWGDRLAILNHPTRLMKRYELLRSLFNSGINAHNVYRLTEGKFPDKYPVFIRGADDHGGARTALIHSKSELQHAIASFNQQGISREDKIIVEFCDTSDSNGVYRKYSAFNVGGTIIPRHVCFSKNWQIKHPDLSTPEFIAEELAFIERNAHESFLREIFSMAGISYGRIDYGLHHGRIQVWEINTNPRLASFISAENPARKRVHDLFVQRINQKFLALDIDPAARMAWVGNPVRKQLMLERVFGHAKYFGEAMIFLLPFSHRANGRIRETLVAFKNRIQM
jgi:hypothetical protein